MRWRSVAMMALTIGGNCLSQDASLTCTWDSLVNAAIVSKNEGRQGEALSILDEAYAIAERLKDMDLLIRTLAQRGLVHLNIGRFEKAWLYWTEAFEIARRAQDMDAIAELHNYLGVVRYQLKDHDSALDHFKKSLELRKAIGTAYDLGVMLNNMGSYEKDYGDPLKALRYLRESEHHWEAIGFPSWKSTTYAHIGECFEKLNVPDSAKWYYEKAFDFIRHDENRPRKEARLIQLLGEWHLQHGNVRKAIQDCGRSLAFAELTNNFDHIVQNCMCLSKAYEKVGDHSAALEHYKRAVALTDSVALEDQRRQIAFMETSSAYEQKMIGDSLKRAAELERAELRHAAVVSHEKNNRNLFVLSTLGVLLVSGGLYNRLRFIRRSRELVRAERDRADHLLHNILPGSVAEELLATGHAKAREFAQATVLFTDFHGFTGISEQLSATELVALIDDCFKEFDRIIRRYGIEKIKTVGDCYMACGGVPDGKGSPIEVVHAALELQEYMIGHRKDRIEKGLPFFTMRIGVHTGPVVAGVVGLDKFAYDIWGDTVNIAARMENTGEIGKVNISAHTYELIARSDELRFIPRGMVQTKGKGRLQMYFVERASIPEEIVPSAELIP